MSTICLTITTFSLAIWWRKGQTTSMGRKGKPRPHNYGISVGLPQRWRWGRERLHERGKQVKILSGSFFGTRSLLITVFSGAVLAFLMRRNDQTRTDAKNMCFFWPSQNLGEVRSGSFFCELMWWHRRQGKQAQGRRKLCLISDFRGDLQSNCQGSSPVDT